jgi:hypothetical protein
MLVVFLEVTVRLKLEGATLGWRKIWLVAVDIVAILIL